MKLAPFQVAAIRTVGAAAMVVLLILLVMAIAGVVE